ncbi:hypothetical protein Pst134EA_007509 [Puccinia striiformis f. sp. tritici]|nr:hypothetical protein Pst134EA_007509 [Puccinia striiformis f. sp. tritici]KAH9470243.1 hypothetical protein Pst134EA_007509 [Puccinia striiformis f. sp. tritici]
MFPSLVLIPNSLPLTFPSPGKQRRFEIFRASLTMYSAVCPIGDPARDLSRAQRPAQQVVSQRRPTLASSQLSRPKGAVFSVDNLPQEIKNLKPYQRNGVIFNLDDLPQELIELQLFGVATAKPT